jgi:SSS family solute:Na+ symporter
MAGNFYGAIYAWTTCFLLTVLISWMTRPRPEAELVGLVYALTKRPSYRRLGWLARPATLAVAVGVLTLALNWIFR